MTTATTPTYKQARQAFEFKAPSVQISGRGNYRTQSHSINGDGSKLVIDHTPTGGDIKAYIADAQGRTIQCYRYTGKGMVKCSPEVYDWGWVAR